MFTYINMITISKVTYLSHTWKYKIEYSIFLAKMHYKTIDSYNFINIIVSGTRITSPNISDLNLKIETKYGVLSFDHSLLNYCKNYLMSNMCKYQQYLLFKSVELWYQFTSKCQWLKSRKIKGKDWTSLNGTCWLCMYY